MNNQDKPIMCGSMNIEAFVQRSPQLTTDELADIKTVVEYSANGKTLLGPEYNLVESNIKKNIHQNYPILDIKLFGVEKQYEEFPKKRPRFIPIPINHTEVKIEIALHEEKTKSYAYMQNSKINNNILKNMSYAISILDKQQTLKQSTNETNQKQVQKELNEEIRQVMQQKGIIKSTIENKALFNLNYAPNFFIPESVTENIKKAGKIINGKYKPEHQELQPEKLFFVYEPGEKNTIDEKITTPIILLAEDGRYVYNEPPTYYIIDVFKPQIIPGKISKEDL